MSGLYDTPNGVLMDPRTAMLTQMGMGLMAASGPSRMPVPLGAAMGKAGMQGLEAFNQSVVANRQMAEVQRQQEERKQKEAALAQLMQDPKYAQYAPLLKAGVPIQTILDRVEPKQPAAHSLSPGGALVGPDGKVIYQAPFKPEAPKEVRPMTRTVQMGEEKVTQEYVNGEWREIGRGPAFAKTVAPAVNPNAAAPQPKAPTGFRWNAEGTALEPIPGGPKDTSAKDAAKAQGAIQKADLVIAKVDEALKQVGPTSTGTLGRVMGMVPGTTAYDLDKTIDTIKANLGFSELQAMRDASPTGGALGQVAVQELSMLQSTIASLDKGQSKEALVRGLQQVRKHFDNWKNALLQAQQSQATQGEPATPQRRVYDPKTGTFK